MPPRTRAKALEGEIVGAPIDESDDAQAELERIAKPTKIGGITVMMIPPNETQIAILLRLSRAVEREATVETVGRLFETFFMIMESLLPVAGDAQRLEDLMVVGKLSVTELSEVWGASGEDSAPNRRTRRARGK